MVAVINGTVTRRGIDIRRIVHAKSMWLRVLFSNEKGMRQAVLDP
jgi:hypothetical protein